MKRDDPVWRNIYDFQKRLDALESAVKRLGTGHVAEEKPEPAKCAVCGATDRILFVLPEPQLGNLWIVAPKDDNRHYLRRGAIVCIDEPVICSIRYIPGATPVEQ